jgi:MFS family permease
MPKLPAQVWMLAIGRLLSQIGSGLTLFYAPIFFVNQLGLSATAVGLAIGSQSITGVIGRLLSGSLVDRLGRKPILLSAMALSAIGAGIFALAHNLPTLVVGNLCFGLGVGLYWPANESLVADLTTSSDERRTAYAFTRLADNLGMGIGIVGGGLMIQMAWDYRWLFSLDALSFIIFAGVIFWGIRETKPQQPRTGSAWGGYKQALRDRRLQLYLLVNIIFTTYMAQLETTMPLYITKFAGGTTAIVTALFTLNLVMLAVSQLPVIKWLRPYRHPHALGIAASFCGVGFICTALATIDRSHSLGWLVFTMIFWAIAIAAYNPTASALTADIAPVQLMGVYTSLNSLCWAVGFAIGPPLGGWAMDQSVGVVQIFWGLLALGSLVMWVILLALDRLLLQSHPSSEPL